MIPQALQEEGLTDRHEGQMGGHLGLDKTFGRLQEQYYWPIIPRTGVETVIPVHRARHLLPRLVQP